MSVGYLHRSLCDVSEFDDFLEDIELLPAVPAAYRIDFEIVHTPFLHVQWLTHHGDATMETGRRPCQWLSVQYDGPGRLSSGGVEAPIRSVYAAEPESHFCAVSGPIRYAVLALPGEEVDTFGRPIRDLRPDPAMYVRIAGLLACLNRLARLPEVPAAEITAVAESTSDALHAIIEAASVGASSTTSEVDPDVANQIVADAVIAIREGRATSVAELVEQVAASRSSLYRSFDAVVGMSPYAYMQRRRLVRLRRRLLETEPGPGAVTQEAAKVGAFHLGNLAHKYREMFDERPSDTVQRSLRSVGGDDPVWHGGEG